MVASAVIAAVGTVAGASIASSGAKSAANTEANAAQNAANMQMSEGQYASQQALAQRSAIDALFQPYADMGVQGMNALTGSLPYLEQSFNPTMAQLEQTPGYQFQLQQGLEQTQNGFAARGLGTSGAAMKGAMDYASGLAAKNYGQQAGVFWQNQNNLYNRLMGLIGVGQNAVTGQAQANTALTGMSTNALTGQANAAAQTNLFGAQATAAGQIGSANAIASGLSNAASLGAGAMAYNSLTPSSPVNAAATPNAWGATGTLFRPTGGWTANMNGINAVM